MPKDIRILVAEDNDGDFDLMMEYLEEDEIPFHIDRARNGEEVLPLLETIEQLPNIVLLDINMPRMSGLEVLHKLKLSEKYKHIPIAIFTSSEAHRDVDSAKEGNANGYMVKPAEIHLEDLAAFIAYAELHPEDFVELKPN